MTFEELKALVEKATANYEAQKKANEEAQVKINALETKLTETLTTIEKLEQGANGDQFKKAQEEIEELKNEISDLREKQKSPVLAIGDEKQKNAMREVARKAFGVVMKRSQGTKGDLLTEAFTEMDVQVKALNISTPGEGGYAVAEVLSRDVMDYAREYSPIVNLIMRKNGLTRDYRQLIRVTWPGVRKGSENTTGVDKTLTDTQLYVEVRSKRFKLEAQPYITNEALMGVDIDIYADLIAGLGEEIGVYLANQILYGDGSDDEARGILSAARVNITDGTGESWKPTMDPTPANRRSPDFFPAYGTGVAGSIGVDHESIIDFVIDVTNTLPTKYLGNAVWLMNRKTKGVFQKVRDTQGRPIFQYDYVEGLPGRRLVLEGYPVIIDDTMPDLATDSLFAIFGDLSKAYAYNDGDINQMILDPYTRKGGLTVYTEREMFEMVQRSDAILVLAATTNDDQA